MPENGELIVVYCFVAAQESYGLMEPHVARFAVRFFQKNTAASRVP